MKEERIDKTETKQNTIPQVSLSTRYINGPVLGPYARDGHIAALRTILYASQRPGRLDP
jgi:hypothetical protein